MQRYKINVLPLQRSIFKKNIMDNKKSLQTNYSELTDTLVDITHYAVTEQKINTICFYPVTIDDENNLEIKIRKEEDKYKILLFGDKWKTIKRSDIEDLEILLTLNQLLIQSFKIIKNIEQYNK